MAWCASKGCYIATIRPCNSTRVESSLARIHYVLTGGLGGLGLRAASLLMKQGAPSVVLASRSRVYCDRHTSSDAATASCDIADKCDAGGLLMNAVPTCVLHMAGTHDKGLLVELAFEAVQKIFAPKAHGAWNLHVSAPTVALHALVVFSSVGSGLGNVGQANYASPSAYLDANALSRRAQGLMACSLQWPLIGGAGMGAAVFSVMRVATCPRLSGDICKHMFCASIAGCSSLRTLPKPQDDPAAQSDEMCTVLHGFPDRKAM